MRSDRVYQLQLDSVFESNHYIRGYGISKLLNQMMPDPFLTQVCGCAAAQCGKPPAYRLLG
jgi:hypothetical protein